MSTPGNKRQGLYTHARGAGYLMAIAGVVALPVVIIKVPQLVGLVPEVLALLAVAWMAFALVAHDQRSSVPSASVADASQAERARRAHRPDAVEVVDFELNNWRGRDGNDRSFDIAKDSERRF